MRLLELQRGALGLPARERQTWETQIGSDGSIPVPETPLEPHKSAVLAVEATAFPSDGVIAGAVVTLGLSIANEGAAFAPDLVVTVPLPGGAAYRPGTFVWNGRSTYDDVAENVFGTGLAIGGLAPGDRATFTWKVGVKLGNKPLVVAAALRAPGCAVVGAHPLVIGRKQQAGSAFGDALTRADSALYEPAPLIPVDIPATELPIYELDEEEQIAHEATDAALSSAALPVFEKAETSPAEPVVAAPQTEPVVEAPPPVPAVPAMPAAPEPVVAAEPEPAPESAPREAVVLAGRFDRATIAFFERVFEGARAPTILQHCILGGALACAGEPDGSDPAGLRKHLDAQSQVLHRIVLHEKLGKKEPIGEYAGDLLATLENVAPKPVAGVPGAPRKDSLVLCAELSEPTRLVLQRISEERGRWDFVKARQLTLALQAQSVAAGTLDPALRTHVESVLRAYAQASVTVLQKLFVRIRIDRTTAVLFQTEPTADAAAKAVLAALKSALDSLEPA